MEGSEGKGEFIRNCKTNKIIGLNSKAVFITGVAGFKGINMILLGRNATCRRQLGKSKNRKGNGVFLFGFGRKH